MDSKEAGHGFAVRVLSTGPREARAYARNHSFPVGEAASLRAQDAHPSAIEYLLGALGGDLVNAFRALALQKLVTVHALELSLSGRLDNLLVHLGVIGEEGDPALEAIAGTLYVSAEADDETLADLWRTVLDRSPLFRTLSRCATVSLEMRPAP